MSKNKEYLNGIVNQLDPVDSQIQNIPSSDSTIYILFKKAQMFTKINHIMNETSVGRI